LKPRKLRGERDRGKEMSLKVLTIVETTEPNRVEDLPAFAKANRVATSGGTPVIARQARTILAFLWRERTRSTSYFSLEGENELKTTVGPPL